MSVKHIDLTRLLLVVTLGLATPAVLADAWRVDPAASRLNFVSVKNDAVGEVHAFTRLSGGVDGSGIATLEVDLDSVDTGIDIRDQRMREMLFETARFGRAVIRAQLGADDMAALAPGAQRHLETTLTLDLHGASAELPAELTVTGLDAGLVLVATSKPVVVNATSFGLAPGVEALREVAKLKTISIAVPVTAQLVLQRSAD